MSIQLENLYTKIVATLNSCNRNHMKIIKISEFFKILYKLCDRFKDMETSSGCTDSPYRLEGRKCSTKTNCWCRNLRTPAKNTTTFVLEGLNKRNNFIIWSFQLSTKPKSELKKICPSNFTWLVLECIPPILIEHGTKNKIFVLSLEWLGQNLTRYRLKEKSTFRTLYLYFSIRYENCTQTSRMIFSNYNN